MDLDSPMVVIDLGDERGEPPTYGSPTRSTVRPWFPAAVLSALLLVFVAGAAGPARSPLSTLFSIAVTPADGYTLTDDGQLLAQTFGQLRSYDLDSGRLHWRSDVRLPAYKLRTSGGVVLMRPYPIGVQDPGTTAVSAYTGVSLWRTADTIVTVPGSSALLAVAGVRSLAGAGRRISGPVQSLDPDTGEAKWTVEQRTPGVLLGVPGPGDAGARMLLLGADQVASLRDLDTGQELAHTTFPPADYGPENPSVAGGYVLLRHPGAQGMELSAYDPFTLRQLWTEPAYGASIVTECGELACLTGTDGIRAIDPSTGDQVWARADIQSIEQQGTAYVAYSDYSGDHTIGVIDPGTGRVRVPLNGWRPIGDAGNGGLLVVRATDVGSRTMVAVARSGDPLPLPLAELPDGTGDCQAAPARLVCRSADGELVVRAYGPKG